MSNSDKFISRKEIALEIGVTAESIRQNESRYGLDKIRVKINERVVIYPRSKATQMLRSVFPGTFSTC